MKYFDDIYDKHPLLVVCGIISFILLIIFLVLQWYQAKLLNLDAKWLIIAGVPLLYGLIAGGYIRSFKGFGIELETQLKSPLKELTLIATDAIMELPGDMKKSDQYLDNLSNLERFKKERLIFYTNKKNYYDLSIVRRYLRRLPNLKFIEIKSEYEQFVGLLPIEIFKTHEYHTQHDFEEGYNINDDVILKLIEAINNDQVLSLFNAEIILERVGESEPLIEILPKVRDSKNGILAVVTNEGSLRGIVTKELVEAKIADEVLLARKRAR